MKPLSLPQILFYSTATWGANMVYMFANTAFPLFLKAYPVPNWAVGFLAQERSFVGGFVQPVVGAISDRLPPNPLGRRRPFLLIGVPLAAAGLVFFSTNPPLWAVIALMTVFSFLLAVANDPYLALMPDIVPPKQRGRVGGVMALFTMLGGITTVALSAFLWNDHRELVFWLVATGLVITFAITFFTIKEPPWLPRTEPGKTTVARRGYLRDLLSRTELLKYLAATFLFWLGNGGITPFITRFAVDVLKVEEGTAFLLVLPAIAGAALFAVPAGLLTERIGKKPVLSVGMCMFGLVTFVGSGLVSDVSSAIVLMSLVGVANAITTALIFPLLADMIPRDRAGEFTGIGALVWSLAQPIGAVGAGTIADVTGTLRGAFAVGGLAMLLGFVLLLTVRPDKQIRHQTSGSAVVA